MHRMHIINAILNYKKMQTRGGIFGWERLCIVDRRFYFDGGDFISIQSLRGKISYISQAETLFRGRLYFVTRRPKALAVSGYGCGCGGNGRKRAGKGLRLERDDVVDGKALWKGH